MAKSIAGGKSARTGSGQRKRTLYLHAGGSKTGSSALQNFFETHASRLEDYGFAYEHRLNIQSGSEVNSGNGMVLYRLLASPGATTQEIDALVSSYFGSCANAICSSEYFAELRSGSLEKLIGSCARQGITIQLICYVRNVIPFLQSSYDQALKGRGECRQFEEWVTAANWQHACALRVFAERLPRKSIRVLHYDKEKNLIGSFLGVLGIEATFRISPDVQRRQVNRSLTGAERDVLRALNMALGPTYSRELSGLLIGANPNAAAEPVSCPKATVNVLHERFAGEVDWVNATFFKGRTEVSVLPEPRPRVKKAARLPADSTNVEKQVLDWAIRKLGSIKDETGRRVWKALKDAIQYQERHPEIPPEFNLVAYLLLNPDILLSEVDPIQHFISDGRREGRPCEFETPNVSGRGNGMDAEMLVAAADFSPRSLQAPNAWIGHLPFAAWVIRAISPKVFVELGTHSGNSYLSFCQSVLDGGLPTKCYAIDTWNGDEHSGRYGEEVFAQLHACHQPQYSEFSTLMRMTFDEAVACFEDGSIELLHIDGLHTYEAVRHDFETWLPKLAPGAIVMFHDTNVFERDFGVWKFWRELQARYPANLEFDHSHGLGVLQLDAPQGRSLTWLQPDSPPQQMLKRYFAALGARQLERYESNVLRRALEERDALIAAMSRQAESAEASRVGEILWAVALPDSKVLEKSLREQWYRQQNPDIDEEGLDPYMHWAGLGRREGRLPSADPLTLVRELVGEREQANRMAIEEGERKLRQLQHDSDERTRILEAEMTQSKLRARYEVDTVLRKLADRERAFAEKLSKIQQAAGEERIAQMEAAQQQVEALAEQYAQRERSLRTAIEEKERELHAARIDALERQKALENQAAQALLNARHEADTRLAQRERSLAKAIEGKEREMHRARLESLEQQKMLEAELARVEREARHEVERQLRTLVEREHMFAEQLLELRQVANRQQALVEDQYRRILLDLANKLGAIQSTWSWRLTAPLRSLASRLGGKAAIVPIHLESNIHTMTIDEQGTIAGAREEDGPGSPQSLHELLARPDEDFINAAYLTVLGRDPDAEGAKFYLERLRQGVSKLKILDQLRASPEGEVHWERMRALNWKHTQGGQHGPSGEGLAAVDAQGLPPRTGQIDAAAADPHPQADMAPASSGLADPGQNAIGSYEFDADWYLATYPDVAEAGGDPRQHYLHHGKTDGRFSCFAEVVDTFMPDSQQVLSDPKYVFDRDWYLKVYADVAAARMDPLIHYLKQGRADGRLRCQKELADTCLIDHDWYLKTYPDVAAAGLDPLEHYLTQGKSENRLGARLPLAFFDPDWYLNRNPDVAVAGADPLQHYVNEGAAQGRPYSTFKEPHKVEAEPLVFSQPLSDAEVKLIAFYLPQFHPIPENDKWWGKGFTEWTNVSRAKPFYQGHDQPRLPGELGYYDLRLVDVMERQAELARMHGVHGFCFYVYWFGGKRLLESPVEMLLRHPEIDINFCYCWANENWTRRWDGLDEDVLIGQDHSPEDDIAFISSISVAFHDKRYIRVDGKPMLTVYRPGLLPDIKATVERWRTWCRDNGIGEIHVCFTESFDKGDPAEMGMDASIEFPPSTVPQREVTPQVPGLDGSFKGQVHNYMCAAKSAKSYVRPGWLQYRGVMPSWDNTPRKMERGISFHGATPELYAEWLDTAVTETRATLPQEQRFVFINAWNEWGEGAYLEPDGRRGYAYLNRTREVMAKYSDAVTNQDALLGRKKKKNAVAAIIHLHYGDLFDLTAKYLDNFSGKADLYFSVRDGCFPEMKEVITRRFPDAVVVSYPNHGRDVLPFLHIFSHIRSFGYKAICKIHSKKSKHRADGDQWRDDVYGKLLGDAKVIRTCVDRIASGTGVIAPAGHLLDGGQYWGANAKRVTELALRMGCPLRWMDKFHFPAGTMFWFRPDALKPLMDLQLHGGDFEAEGGQVDGTTAHAIERLIGLSAMKSGLGIADTAAEGEFIQVDYPFAAKTEDIEVPKEWGDRVLNRVSEMGYDGRGAASGRSVTGEQI